MSEEQKTTEESAEQAAQPVAMAAEESKEDYSSIRDSQGEEKVIKTNLNALEELPDSIKKLLEKKKAERASDLKKKKRKKKADKKVTIGRAYVKATYNNTIITLTDMQGDVISWASAGIAGFKGPKKSTPYAAQIITRIAVERAREFGLSEVTVYVKGVGTGRESAVRALNANGLIINAIKDMTPIPHGGCRPKKPRRV